MFPFMYEKWMIGGLHGIQKELLHPVAKYCTLEEKIYIFQFCQVFGLPDFRIL